MIKVFIPQSKGKIKTSVRGFWRNEVGKTFYDYLKVEAGRFSDLEFLQWKHKQEALFYINGKIGCIYNKGKVEILPHRIFKEVLKVNLKVAIKEALTRFSGCTIYNKAGRYYIEVFTTI